MKRTTLLAAVLAVIIVHAPISPTSAAPRVYRCNGRVQLWPCGTVLPNGRRTNRSMLGEPRSLPAPRATPPAVREFRGQPLSAAVITSAFVIDRKRQGVWTGRVKGNGEVKLFLQILRGDRVESTQPMGSTILADQESSFTYKSVPPHGTDWSYIIVAQSFPVVE